MTNAELVRDVSKTTKEPDARAQLRQDQARVAQARKAAQAAAQASERAQAVVARCIAGLSACGPVDDDIARHRAADVRAGSTGAGPLPNALATRRQRQQRAQEEAADAKRTLALLDGETAEARAAVDQAEVELRVTVDAVLVATAMGQLTMMQDIEREAGRCRAQLSAFLGSRTLSDAPVPWPLMAALPFDPAHSMLLDRAPQGAAEPGAWIAYRRALVADANAKFETGCA